ncbi:hypothetical protein EWE75_20310 [Sphingomonas populi]|uniref:Uncharacterized protein n=1 Tax=Sphingomonas populi TaxID=2484750 RepID=A0A4Q6XTZ8_9SPHN|nr:hypothetical protein [Sphingomonas populi]RZF60944.1 hypothetical protein EWE75_20310 [Sphingomonas populi]
MRLKQATEKSMKKRNRIPGAARKRAIQALASALLAACALPARAQVDPLAPTGRFSIYQTKAAQTPPMGWNPWNAFHTDVDEAKIRAVARDRRYRAGPERLSIHQRR